MSKTVKTIIAIVSAVLVIAAAVAAIIVYKDEIMAFFNKVKDKLSEKKSPYTPEECEDFADI